MLRALLVRSLLVAVVLAAAPSPVAAQQADSLRVFLVTFGPGAQVWERFGHNALWIQDPARSPDRAYHYGLFDMSEEGFLLHFLQGRMWYSMGDAPAEWMLEAYRRIGRHVTVQELRLGQDRIRELRRFLEWNLLPENRVYRYDYFRDNCSTRIRDALDQVLDGRLREELAARPAPRTYRREALGLTARDRLLTTGMDLGLGPLADQPLTRWELAFIPMRLRDDLRRITIEQDGELLPLVAGEAELPPIGAGDPRLAGPSAATRSTTRIGWHLVLGLVIGGIFAAAGSSSAPRGAGTTRTREAAARTRRVTIARWVLTVGGTLWGLLAGILGTILLALWTLTDHEFAWRNENLLQANPLALALVVLVPLAVVGGRRTRAARLIALLLLVLSVLGLLLHPLPVTRQANLAIIALALPIHLGLAWALHRAPRTTSEPSARPERSEDPASA